MIRTLPAILFVWAGLLAGVSFVATPAKFLAPSLPLSQALDVGRSTFHVLALIEYAFFVLALGGAMLVQARLDIAYGRVIICLGGIAALLAFQGLWIRPVLDERVLAIMSGKSVPPSGLHALYIGVEAVKLALVLSAAVMADQTRAGGRNP